MRRVFLGDPEPWSGLASGIAASDGVGPLSGGDNNCHLLDKIINTEVPV